VDSPPTALSSYSSLPACHSGAASGDLHALFSTLGFPLFDPLATATEAENPAELFLCRSPGAGVDGRGVYTPEGFVVLAGSVGRLENVPSIQGTNDGRVRERLIAAGVMEVSEAGTITFLRDHLFRSPSSAAAP